MSWQHFALRVVVMATVVLAFAFTIGLGSIPQVFAIGLAASLASHAVLLGMRKLTDEDDNVSMRILLLCVLGAAGAGVFAVIERPPSVDEGPRYRTIEELMATPAELVDQPTKLRGQLVYGSRSGHQFLLDQGGARVRVHYADMEPFMLRDPGEIVTTGRLVRDKSAAEYLFVADKVIERRR